MLNYFVMFLVGTLAAARVTRLIVEDDFPPAVAVRNFIDSRFPAKWATLFHCPFCMGFWVSLMNLTWAWFWPSSAWWFVNLAFAGAYVIAWIVYNDQGFALVHEYKNHEHEDEG